MGLISNAYHVTSDLTQLRFLFVNLFLLGHSDSWVLIDAGLRGSAMAIIKTVEKSFGKGAKPKAIILTHGHFDHTGALPELLRHWDVPVYAHELEMPHLIGKADYPRPDPTVGKGLLAISHFCSLIKPSI